MKKLLFTILCLSAFVAAKAQTADTAKADTQKFAPVDTSPEPMGGAGKLYNYIIKNIKYPKVAKKDKVQGRVIVAFIVENDGSITDIKIKQSLSPETDAEALRVMSDPKAPKWTPGLQAGKPVRVQYTIPIPFTLNN